MTRYEPECIPDESFLYCRVHITAYCLHLTEEDRLHGMIPLKAIQFNGPALSADWCRYSSPGKLKCRSNEPEKNGVVSFVAGAVRERGLRVIHDPLDHNRGHSLVEGSERSKVKAILRRTIRWVPGFELECEENAPSEGSGAA